MTFAGGLLATTATLNEESQGFNPGIVKAESTQLDRLKAAVNAYDLLDDFS